MAELIDPPSITDMPQSDLERMITDIRERRQRLVRFRDSSRRAVGAGGSVNLAAKLLKLTTRLDKAIDDIDARLSKAEGHVAAVVSLRLEMGEEPQRLAEEVSDVRSESEEQ